VCDIVKCAIEKRIAIVETGADESIRDRYSVIVETVSDVSECLQVIARLGNLVGMFIESERLV